MASYYLYRNKENHGPYPEAQLRAMIAYGEVKGEELIYEVNGTEWIPASSIPVSPTDVSIASSPPQKTLHSPPKSKISNKQFSSAPSPGGIKFIGWYHICVGAFYALISFAAFIMPSSELISDPTVGAGQILLIRLILFLFVLGLGVLYFISGNKLLAGKRWAWVTSLVLCIIGILGLNLLSLIGLIILLKSENRYWCTQ